MSTDFSFHASASTEDSSTKDTTDEAGLWQEFEVMSRSYDIQVSALVAAGTESGSYSLNNLIGLLKDTPIGWELALASGEQNRVKGQVIASGLCKLVSLNPSGQNRQKAVFSATFNGYGPITVGS